MEESENQNKRSLRRFYENEGKVEIIHDDYLKTEDLVSPKKSVPISTP